MLGVSSKTKEIVIERMFWWITGRTEDRDYRKRGDEDDINPYWCWTGSGDIIAYTPNLLNAEQLNELFNKV